MKISKLVKSKNGTSVGVLVTLDHVQIVIVEDLESVKKLFWSLVILSVLDNPALEHIRNFLRDSQVDGILRLVELGVAQESQSQAQGNHCSFVHFLLFFY